MYLVFVSLQGYVDVLLSILTHRCAIFFARIDEWSTLHYIILAYLLMKSPWYILLIHSLNFSYSEHNTHPHPRFLWPLFISPAHISYHPLQILTRARYSYEGSWLFAPAGGNSSVNWKYPRARSLVILYTKPLPTGPEICALDQQICEKDISGSLEIKHADYATS